VAFSSTDGDDHGTVRLVTIDGRARASSVEAT
jgi:hypothetical protein